jgi:hypothetical protein
MLYAFKGTDVQFGSAESCRVDTVLCICCHYVSKDE